ncbi:hypothetical protein ACNI65_22020 [Roseateles sp. So40a]|uniref:hypothetical protein n=1 Tax=Roseateles sp. So40a TaxID=3400226 RepID=UPI003A87035F
MTDETHHLNANTAIHVPERVADEVGLHAGVFMVAYVHRLSDGAYLLALGDPKAHVGLDGRSRRSEPAGKPSRVPLSLIERHLVRGAIGLVSILKYEWQTSYADKLTECQQRHVDKWTRVLRDIIDNHQLERMFVFGRFSEIITSVVKLYRVSESSVKKKLVRYFLSGGSLEVACMPTHGLPRTQLRKVSRKLGAKSKKFKARENPEDEGFNATEEAKLAVATFHRTCAEQVNREAPGTTRNTPVSKHWRDYLTQYVDVPEEIGPDGRVNIGTNPTFALTERQFLYYWRKEESALAEAKRRAGELRWAKDRRVITSHARVEDLFPGSTYIIDSTIADVYLVSSLGRKRLIGRPVIYVVLDAFSYLILAVHVCLEAASADQAKIALYQAVTPKERSAEALSLRPQVAEGLVAGVIPQTVFSDRGSDVLSMKVREANGEAGIIHAVAAAYRADWKALVERYFKLQNDAEIHFLPGATKGRQRERGDRDCRLDGKLTLADLKRLLLALAAEWNLTHDCSEHVPRSLSNCGEEFLTTPLGLYEAGLRWLHGSAAYMSRDEAVRTFLAPLKGHARRDGITHEKTRYVASWMIENAWYFHRMQDGQLTVYRDPDAQTRCFLFGEHGERLEAAILDRRGDLAGDVFLDDHADAVAHATYDADDIQKSLAGQKKALTHIRKQEVEEAIRQSEFAQANDSRPASQKLGDLRANRAAEMAHQQGATPLLLHAAPGKRSNPARSTEPSVDLSEAEEMRQILRAIE